MNPKDLAILLNVSQAQIARIIAKADANNTVSACPTVSLYMLESWAREMRDAEIYLRDYFRKD